MAQDFSPQGGAYVPFNNNGPYGVLPAYGGMNEAIGGYGGGMGMGMGYAGPMGYGMTGAYYGYAPQMYDGSAIAPHGPNGFAFAQGVPPRSHPALGEALEGTGSAVGDGSQQDAPQDQP